MLLDISGWPVMLWLAWVRKAKRSLFIHPREL